jgi:hypothetical protein
VKVQYGSALTEPTLGLVPEPVALPALAAMALTLCRGRRRN